MCADGACCGKGFGTVKIELYKGTVLSSLLVASTPNNAAGMIAVPAVRTAASD